MRTCTPSEIRVFNGICVVIELGTTLGNKFHNFIVVTYIGICVGEISTPKKWWKNFIVKHLQRKYKTFRFYQRNAIFIFLFARIVYFSTVDLYTREKENQHLCESKQKIPMNQINLKQKFYHQWTV